VALGRVPHAEPGDQDREEHQPLGDAVRQVRVRDEGERRHDERVDRRVERPADVGFGVMGVVRDQPLGVVLARVGGLAVVRVGDARDFQVPRPGVEVPAVPQHQEPPHHPLTAVVD
jgi:hypothetical protein